MTPQSIANMLPEKSDSVTVLVNDNGHTIERAIDDADKSRNGTPHCN